MGLEHTDNLTMKFTALADPTRRSIVDHLGRGSASVSELAEAFDMGLPSFLKHVRFLENSGMIRTKKIGRTRTCRLERSGFLEVGNWLSTQRAIWEGRADRLEQFVLDEQAQGEE